ncbi:MAG: methyltransferase [Rubrivivax sp.]|nr:methyltransferase [Rubrivivax sp.]
MQADAALRFLRLLAAALSAGAFVKLLLTKPLGVDAPLERLLVRELPLRGERQLSFLRRYPTRDVTKNHSVAEGLKLIDELLGARFHNAHLLTHTAEVRLACSRKGKPSLRRGKPSNAVTERPGGPAHDREKQRHLALDRPFWTDLGVTQRVRDELRLVPAMSRKWKQINKFIEVFDAACKRSALAESADVHVADFGSGKGYLTFAIHLGLRAGAAIIMCSPCRHKQLRPQMRSPAALRPLLQHGIHLGQEAEMVTDTLRAMLLEAMGYETQVFEFVALEHTSKNKMILAVKRSGAAAAAAASQRPELLTQIAEVKRFYGLREQCLETLLQAQGWLPGD